MERKGAYIERIPFYLLVGAVWLLLWMAHSFFAYPETFFLHCINEAWRAVYIVAVNFVFFECCFSSMAKQRSGLSSILSGVLFTIVLVCLLSFGLYLWGMLGNRIGLYPVLRQVTLVSGDHFHLMLESVLYEAESGVVSVFFFGMTRLLYSNVKLREAAQQMRIEKQEAELNFLKSQTNPHFLFNTLNNIYSLARDKNDLAPESVLRLSKIMRFMLYESGKDLISIEQELDVITDYIELEKLRHDTSLRVRFTCDIDDMKQLFSPLLLMPLVENAFKHGAAEASGETFVSGRLIVKNRQLTFILENSAEPEEGFEVTENIGLSNLRRQLELLYDDHSLSIKKENSLFTATLRINLASHE